MQRRKNTGNDNRNTLNTSLANQTDFGYIRKQMQKTSNTQPTLLIQDTHEKLRTDSHEDIQIMTTPSRTRSKEMFEIPPHSIRRTP